MSAATGSCHCGAVTITAPRRPDYINACNCSICTKLGWRCFYFGSDEVTITGRVDGYIRADMAEPCLEMMRCAVCGCPSFWRPLSEPPHERMGINANLFDAAFLDGVEVRPVDGRSWAL